MMTESKMIFAMILGLSATSAFAMDATLLGGKGDDGKGGFHGKPGQTIGWDEFQGRCANPASFDQQIAPTNIVVQCTDVMTEFVPEAPGSIELTGTRTVSAQVTSDKWIVGGVGVDAETIQVAGKPGACLRFKEVEKTLTVEHALSCGDVVGLKGTLNEFCRGVVDGSKGSNPKLGSIRDTGRIIDSCAGLLNPDDHDHDHDKGDDHAGGIPPVAK